MLISSVTHDQRDTLVFSAVECAMKEMGKGLAVKFTGTMDVDEDPEVKARKRRAAEQEAADDEAHRLALKKLKKDLM